MAATRKSARQTPPRSRNGEFRKKGANHWGTAAIVGGVAAVGAAATAALFALRGSSWNEFEDMVLRRDDADTPETAHQADGTDSTASFDARIADEGTIPA